MGTYLGRPTVTILPPGAVQHPLNKLVRLWLECGDESNDLDVAYVFGHSPLAVNFLVTAKTESIVEKPERLLQRFYVSTATPNAWYICNLELEQLVKSNQITEECRVVLSPVQEERFQDLLQRERAGMAAHALVRLARSPDIHVAVPSPLPEDMNYD